MDRNASAPGAPAGPHGSDEAYERFKRELHDELRLIRKGRRIPQTRLGDLTPAETEVMMALAHAARHKIEARPGRVARFIDSTPSALSQTLKSLEHKGYVARRRLGTDSRGVVLELTERGQCLAKEGEAAIDAHFRELFEYLGEDDAHTLLRVLGRMASFLTERPREDGTDEGKGKA